jgi:hypothetical protein
MKYAPLVLLSLLASAPLYASDGEHLIPAGSLIQCTVSEPKVSSKTTAIGDPVLCQIGHAERYGRSTLPTDSYLVGRFEDYKDPGHFVGKGWMELKFDRMIIEPNTTIPVDARVVDVPGYRVDNQGRILGKGHAVRDAVMWSIPVLWPIDLLTLPMRGPRPTLKEETRLTLKVMDDLAIPATEPLQRDPSGLLKRQPAAYNELPPEPDSDPVPAQGQAQDQYYPPQDQPAPQDAYNYAPPPPPAYYPAPPPAPVYYGYAAPPPVYYGGGYGGGYGGAAAVRYAYGSPTARYAVGRAQPRPFGYGARPSGQPGYRVAPQGYGRQVYGGGMRAYGGGMAMRGGGGGQGRSSGRR